MANAYVFTKKMARTARSRRCSDSGSYLRYLGRARCTPQSARFDPERHRATTDPPLPLSIPFRARLLDAFDDANISDSSVPQNLPCGLVSGALVGSQGACDVL